MRELFRANDYYALGHTRSELRWGERMGQWVRAYRNVYAVGAEPPDALTKAIARLMSSGAPAGGLVAGAIYGLDGVDGRSVEVPGRSRVGLLLDATIVDGVVCASGLDTLVQLSSLFDDLRWEQALESGLRKRLLTIDDMEAALSDLKTARVPGVRRIRRVLALRPTGAPPTESLLETLMVQLARDIPGVPEPERQVNVFHDGQFVARVDLAWPVEGAFNELDGMHHPGQPVHDARRESAVVAATGWLVGRFTWREVRKLPVSTGRRLRGILQQARRRPIVD